MSPSYKAFLFHSPGISKYVLSQLCKWDDPRERKNKMRGEGVGMELKIKIWPSTNLRPVLSRVSAWGSC
jgi:hypothetical protein